VKYNILITSGGSVNAVNVIQALRQELKWQKNYPKDTDQIPMRLITADADPLSSGLFLADKGYVIPKADDPKFIPELLKICKKEKVKILIPISDYELFIIAKNKKRFENIGVKMAVSKPSVYAFTENKLKVHQWFNENDIPCPKITEQLPVIVKPMIGSGSKDVYKAETKRELDYYKEKVDFYFIQKFIKGQEYTIDGLCDLKGKMLYALPRKRLEVKGGMCVKAETEYNEEMVEYARKISEGLGLVGAFNIQVIKNKKLYFIEVNNRFGSGGLPATIGAGLNIPFDIIRLLLNKKVPRFRTERPWIYNNITMIRYSNAIIKRSIIK